MSPLLYVVHNLVIEVSYKHHLYLLISGASTCQPVSSARVTARQQRNRNLVYRLSSIVEKLQKYLIETL